MDNAHCYRYAEYPGGNRKSGEDEEMRDEHMGRWRYELKKEMRMNGIITQDMYCVVATQDIRDMVSGGALYSS